MGLFARQGRFAVDVRTWLESHYPEVEPYAFYRDLFGVGSLDSKGSMTAGKYCGIAVQVTKEHKAKRYTLTDELDNLPQILDTDDFVVISPMSYAGKTQQSKYQRFCYAVAIDLDSVNGSKGIATLLSHTDERPAPDGSTIRFMPVPTYIVSSSANNVHLYYMFDSPIPMYKSNRESLSRWKTQITEKLWNQNVTKLYNAVQQEPIGQCMRAVGSRTKDGRDKVRAFKVGSHLSVGYLNQHPFVSPENQIHVWNSPEKRDGEPGIMGRKETTVKPAFYDWYKRQISTYAVQGKRYFCIMVMAIIGRKCGVPFEQVEQDALAFVPMLDSKRTDDESHFTPEDALKAITAYDVPHFMFMKRETLVRLSGVPMQANKRNGRTQEAHLRRARAVQNIDYPEGEWRNVCGAPTKKELVRQYMASHPCETVTQIARGCGVSRPTVYKWFEELEQERYSQGKPQDGTPPAASSGGAFQQ